MIDILSILQKINLSQKEFAGVIGKHPSAVNRVSKGLMDFPKEWKSVLLDKFGVNADDFKKQVKVICQAAGPDEIIQVVSYEGNKHVVRNVPKYLEAESHTARRSLATNMSLLGFTDKKIALMMGVNYPPTPKAMNGFYAPFYKIK